MCVKQLESQDKDRVLQNRGVAWRTCVSRVSSVMKCMEM